MHARVARRIWSWAQLPDPLTRVRPSDTIRVSGRLCEVSLDPAKAQGDAYDAEVSFNAHARSFNVYISDSGDAFPFMVRRHAGRMSCPACRSHSCRHILAVSEYAALWGSVADTCDILTAVQLPSAEERRASAAASLKRTCLSYRPLLWDLASPTMQLRRPGLAELLRGPRFLDQLVPEQQPSCYCAPAAASTSASVCACGVCCPLCGSAWGAVDPVPVATDMRIIYEAGPVHGVSMYSRKCGDVSCLGRLQYDGQNDGLFVNSKSEVWDLSLIAAHAESLALDGASFHDLAMKITKKWRIHGTSPAFHVAYSRRITPHL